MSSTIDLHIHTTASDGTDSPEALAAKVAAAGIRLFSITDHDTIEGALAMESMVPEGVRFIRGVEFSCITPAGKCHILGYGYDPESPEFQVALDESVRLRWDKLDRRLRHLRDRFGILLTAEELAWLHSLRSPGNPHLGKLLLKRGLAPDLDTAIQTYLSDVPGPDRFDAAIAIRSIERSGGKSVWAHPLGGEGEKRLSAEEFEQQLKALLSYGIRGLECWYSRYSMDDVRFLLDHAQTHRMVVTGGSDYHGTTKPDLKLGQLNLENIPAKDICPLV